MNTVNLEELESDHFYQLDQYQPVRLIDEAQKVQIDRGGDESDNTFDHFLYDYVGDPGNPNQAPLALRDHEAYGPVLYPHRMYFGFTQSGKMLLVRATTEVDREKPEAYYVVTADLKTDEVTPWLIDSISRDDDNLEATLRPTTNRASEEELGDLLISHERTMLQMPGARFEHVKAMDKEFFQLLNKRRLFRQAETIGKLLTFMAYPSSMETTEAPATLVG